MSAPGCIEISVDAIADAFGDNFMPAAGDSRGPLIPINALHSCAKEIALLTTLVDDHSTTYNDLGMHFLWLSRRMETAAEIGHDEIDALYKRIHELEAQLAKATSEAEAAQ